MVAFISQEAHEKAREIHIKADEEFSIERSKLVRQETSTIDAQYERKFKQAELAQQIARSNVTNKTRLKVLAAQQDLLDELFEKARRRLLDVSKDEGKYAGVLTNLMLEGMYCLNEQSVKIRAREQDYEVVKKSIPEAEKKYTEATGCAVKVEIDDSDPLPAES